MRIGLCQIDGKWPNLALMKLSAYHKSQGDTVEWFMPLESEKYDRVYASKVFSFSAMPTYLPATTIIGGTGIVKPLIRNTPNLPPEVDSCVPDYSLYPDRHKAIGFTTRGCVRSCGFCYVPYTEGSLRVIGDLYSFWTGQKDVVLLDNNLTAAPWEHFERVLKQCITEKVYVDFCQGLDLRLMTDDHAALLARVRVPHDKRLRFAWDSLADGPEIERGLRLLIKHIARQSIMVYVLVGYNTSFEQDLKRVEYLRGYGVDPYVMIYNGRRDLSLREFQRWVNHKAIFKTVTWDEYTSHHTKGVRKHVRA